MDQIERIICMEQRMDRVSMAAEELRKAMDELKDMKDDIDRLKEYYESGLWRQDYEDDEAGKLPEDLKRGVLSQDTLFDLLEETDALYRMIK